VNVREIKLQDKPEAFLKTTFDTQPWPHASPWFDDYLQSGAFVAAMTNTPFWANSAPLYTFGQETE